MKNNKKFKYDRRRALMCKLVRKSKSNKGYFRYDVSIGERDGRITRVPAYGKDMQDALQRLLWKQRTERIEKRFGMGWVFVAWVVTMGWPYFVVDDHTPLFLAFSMGSVMLLFVTLAMFSNYINKE